MTMPALKTRAFGVPIEFRASFLLIVVAVGLPTHLTPGSMLGWVVIATIAVLIHEAGHAAAFMWFGDHPSITLHGAGGQTVAGHPGTRRMIVVSAAGPLAGLLAGLWVVLLSPSIAANPVGRQLINDALFATVGLSLLNLIPLAGLDGHSVLTNIVVAVTGRPAGALGWMLGVVTIAALVVAALWLRHLEIAVTLAILAGLQWRSVEGMLGRPDGPGSSARLLIAGRPAEALVRADDDVRRGRNVTDALLVRAGALAMLTRYGEAEAVYSAILTRTPATLPALAGRSQVRRSLGLTEPADADLHALLAAEPQNPNEVTAQVIGLYHAHLYDRALALVRMHLAKPGVTRPVADHLQTLEAVIECVLGQTETALRHAETLVRRRPDDPGVQELVALASMQLGRWEAAMDHAKRALAGAPRHPELLETLGLVERLSGHSDRAYPHLLEAATQRPGLPRARAELSACFTQLGMSSEAALALENLPEWTADDPFVNYARGCILAAAGLFDEARNHLARAVQIRPNLAVIARLDPILAPLFVNVAAGHFAPMIAAATSG
jgi:tetratricopeptide (TPR) repeat protein